MNIRTTASCLKLFAAAALLAAAIMPAALAAPAEKVVFIFAPPDGTSYILITRKTRIQYTDSEYEPPQATSTIEKVTVTKTAAGYDFEHRSGAEEYPDLYSRVDDPLMKILSGLALTLRVDNEGNLVSVSGLEGLDEKIRDSLPPESRDVFARMGMEKILDNTLKVEWESRIGGFAGLEASIGGVFESESDTSLPNGDTAKFYSIFQILEKTECGDGNTCVRIRHDFNTSAQELSRYMEDILDRVCDMCGIGDETSIGLNSIEGFAERIMDPETMLIYNEKVVRTVKMQIDSGGENNAVTAIEKREYIYEYGRTMKDVIADSMEAMDEIKENLRRAFEFQDQEQYYEAGVAYGEAIAAAPDNAYLYYHRGLMYLESKETLKALADFSRAVELDPIMAEGFFNRGRAYYTNNEPDLAIPDYDRAIELNPTDALPYYGKGYIFLERGELEKALTLFDKAIEADPGKSQFYGDRGYAKSLNGNTQGAIEDYDRAIALNPQDYLTYNNRGFAFAKLGEYEKAFADYEKCIAIAPDFDPVYDSRGAAHMETGNLDAALADFNRAIEMNPQRAVYYENRGMTYEKMGKTAEAEADYKKAEDLESEEYINN